MTAPTLFHRNLVALKPYLQRSVFNALRKHESQHVHVVGEPGSASLNLATPSGPVYKPNAIEYCREQVRQFLNSPRQITLPEYLTGTEKRSSLGAVMAAFISGLDYSNYERGPASYDTVGALVSFGLGLGVHIEELYTKLKCRDLVILEPEFEFLHASLQAVDWGPIVDLNRSRSGHIFFLHEKDPNLIFDTLSMVLRDRSYGLIEGSYLFDHYQHESLLGAKNRFYESGANLLSYNGWVEDEVTHVVNHMENAKFNVRRLLSVKNPELASEKSELNPAIVVGSGPSLNDTIELIRMRRDSITLFSAGTSLGALLKAGLKPDFHCELENVDVVADMIGNLKNDYDLAGITLVASTTVHPAVPPMFEDSIFFFREGEALMRELAGPYGQVEHVGPSGVNTAVTIATKFGFQQIFLFGADFGVPETGRSYATGVAYDRIDLINSARKRAGKAETTAAGSVHSSMNREIAGNTGNTVRSNDTLIGMRHRLESTISTFELDVLTVGSGAKIEGARACDAALFIGLTEKALTTTKPDYFNSVVDIRKGSLFDSNALETIIAGFEHLFAEFHDTLNELIHADTDLTFEMVYDRFLVFMYFPLRDNGAPETRAVRASMSGSLLRLLHMMRSHYIRVSIPDRQRFLRSVLLLVQGMGLAWPATVIRPLFATRTRLQEMADVSESPLEEVIRNISHSLPGHEWDICAALEEIRGKTGSQILAQYILKEYVVRRLGTAAGDPSYDPSICKELESLFECEIVLDRFLFPAVAFLAIGPRLASNKSLIDSVKKLIAHRKNTGPHLLFYAAIFFIHAGQYEYAAELADRASQELPEDIFFNRLFANATLLTGDCDAALAIYGANSVNQSQLRIASVCIDLEPVAIALKAGVPAGLQACRASQLSTVLPMSSRCVEQALIQIQKSEGKESCAESGEESPALVFSEIVRKVVYDAVRINGGLQ